MVDGTEIRSDNKKDKLYNEQEIVENYGLKEHSI